MNVELLVNYIVLRLGLARHDERGASAVEYGLLVALIAAIIIGSVTLLGAKLDTIFTNVKDSLP